MNSMEAAKKIEEQERETLEIVLKEILEEQHKSGKINLAQGFRNWRVNNKG